MSETLPAGPYRTIKGNNVMAVPLYIMPYDEQGHCQAPLTREQLLSTIQDGTYTDILLFSHGWNNDWKGAISSYEGFLNGYMHMYRDYGLTYPRPFWPLLIGVFWPSIALPDESGPAFAGFAVDDPPSMGTVVDPDQQAVQLLTAMLSKNDVERLKALVQRGQDLSPDEALELARLLAPIYNVAGDELPTRDPAPTAGELVALWKKITLKAPKNSLTGTPGRIGFVRTPGTTLGGVGRTNQPAATPEAAGFLDVLDPRLIIRLATVLQMKDRAEVVGAHGVGSLLCDLLKTGTARVHLIGHSYGCKVVLSALCFQKLPRLVNSLLLLQPAISYLCFAENATNEEEPGKPGGYREALKRVEQPIFTTYSPHDVPLTQFFHLAVRRPSDLGDQQIAGAPPPSRYAALGGFGPGGCEKDCTEMHMSQVGDLYDLGSGGRRICVLNGAQAIFGHGDISNDYTWWALYNQMIN